MLKRFTRRRREPEDPNAQYRDAIEDLRSPNVTAKPPPQPYEPQEDAASDKAESPAQYGMRLLERTAILRRAVEKLDDDIYDALVGGSAPSEAVKNTDAGILLDDLLDCALAVAHENGLSVEQRLREARTRTGDW